MTGVRGPRRPLVIAACAVTGAAVLTLVVARAVRVPLTFDEAVTYERTIASGLLTVFDFRTATNHLLNTLLTRVSHAIAGSDAWALRLPNVLAAAGYLAALAAVARRTHHPAVAIGGFVVLASNLYAIDFLALSRGYGLALCGLTVATYGLSRWIDSPPGGPWLGRALLAGVGAVAANFAVLPALLALAGVAVIAAIGRGAVAPSPSGRPWTTPVLILIAAAAYSFAVYSRERVLSPDLFAPVTVRVAGLLDDELADVFVFRQEATGRFRELPRVAPGVWRTDELRDAWGLKIDLPHVLDRNLAAIDVSIGDRTFRRTRLVEGPWQGHDWNGRRVLQSTTALGLPRSRVAGIDAAINWRGDAMHWTLAARFTAATLAALCVLWAGLAIAGRGLVAARRLTAAECGALTSAVLAAAAVSAAPLVLLRRNEELYYGGTAGLVTDTLGSLAYATSYTRWFPAMVVTSLAWLLGAAALLTVALWAAPAARRAARGPMALLAVVLLVLIGVRLQHDVAGAPYPLGRTALFLWPLVGVWLWQLADTLAAMAVWIGRIVSLASITAALVASAHAATACNLERTFDDYADAAVPGMLRTIADEVAGTRRPSPFVHLGVEWTVLPVTRYYAARLELPRSKVLVHVVPDDEIVADYVYVLSPRLAQGTPVQAFPLGRGTLYRVPSMERPATP